MPTHLINQFILTSKLLNKNLNMANSKELKKQKLRKKKLMRKVKRKIKKILHFGKLQRQESQNGNQNGVKGDLAGIYNVQRWHARFSVKN